MVTQRLFSFSAFSRISIRKYLFYLITCYMHYLNTNVTYVVTFGYMSILYISMCMRTQLLSQPPALFDPMDCIAHQAPLSMGFPRQEYWSRLPLPPPGDPCNPGSNPSPASPALAGVFFTTEPPGKLRYVSNAYYMLGTALL